MESGKKNNDSINLNKNITPPFKKYQDDSETCESSYKCVNSSEKNISPRLKEAEDKCFKKSIDYFPKKIYIEEPEYEDSKKYVRKFTIEEELFIKDFVPQLKPIKINLIPSKLCLNKRQFKNLKCNKDNLSSKYFSSCPNSEKESEIDSSFEKIITHKPSIKDIRKDLQQVKNSIPKVLSKNLVSSNCKKFENQIIFDDFENDLKESIELDSDSNEIKNEIKSFSLTPCTSKKIQTNELNLENVENAQGFRKKRINSWSILDVLKMGKNDKK